MTPEDHKHPFVTYLEEHAKDQAMLAALRRGLGRLPGEAPGMFPYVVPFVRQHDEEPNLYLLASLFAVHPRATQRGNMGTHLYKYFKVGGDDTVITRRFVQLLNLHWDELDSALRQHIIILKSAHIPVNWHRLLFDLNNWDHETRFVQKNWAREFWRSPSTQQTPLQS